MLAPFLIYISSPFPVPGTVIVGIVIVSTVGGTKTGVTGVKFIACGKLGCVAVSGVTVGAVNTLGLIPALTSNATIGSLTGDVLAIPYELDIPCLLFDDAERGFELLASSEEFLLSGEVYLS